MRRKEISQEQHQWYDFKISSLETTLLHYLTAYLLQRSRNNTWQSQWPMSTKLPKTTIQRQLLPPMSQSMPAFLQVAASALAFLQAAASALARLIPIPHYFPTEPALHLYYRTGQVQQVVVTVIPTKADSFLVLGAHLEDLPAAEVAPAVFQVDMVAAEVALAMVAVVPPHPC
jgi:hypothetical protein